MVQGKLLIIFEPQFFSWSDGHNHHVGLLSYLCSSTLNTVYCLPHGVLFLTLLFFPTRTLIRSRYFDLRVSAQNTHSGGRHDLHWAMRFKRKFLGPPYKEARRQGDSFFMLSAYFLPLHMTAWEHGALGLLPHLVMEKARSGEIPATAYFQNYCSVGRSPSCFTTIERSFQYFQLNSTPNRDSETVNASWIVNVTLIMYVTRGIDNMFW